jgi:hypothetical protein
MTPQFPPFDLILQKKPVSLFKLVLSNEIGNIHRTGCFSTYVDVVSSNTIALILSPLSPKISTHVPHLNLV